MFSYFTAEHDAFRRVVRRFVETEINPHVEAWEAARIWPAHEVLKKMGNLGLLGLNYPEAYGGGGVDYWYSCLLYTSPSPRDRTRSRMPSSA